MSAKSIRATRLNKLEVRAARVLIANTKGGGHAPFGLYLAKELLSLGHQVTILNDGDPAQLMTKDPFLQYNNADFDVVWGNPADVNSLPPGPFDVVYDNNGKDLAACQPMIDAYCFSWSKFSRIKQYCFVSSAGMCKENPIEPMVFEDSPCKQKGHYFVEEYLKTSFVPYTIFRPLYPYGKFTQKDCEQWFMDRILRNRPVLIPGSGCQLVSLSHYEDCARLMAAALGKERAVYQTYNLTSPAAVSFDGVALAVAKAAGKEANIIHYPESLGKGAWPFRLGHFFASAAKAQKELDWEPKHNFTQDMEECLSRYVASGRLDKGIDFSKDDELLAQIEAGGTRLVEEMSGDSKPFVLLPLDQVTPFF